eukprot:15342282-Alexandrium_andersonii.AAC.1
MSASLVGSEMCIRDRPRAPHYSPSRGALPPGTTTLNLSRITLLSSLSYGFPQSHNFPLLS